VEPAVVARGLAKRFGAHEAVKNVDFDIPAGSTFAFLGPNGAGKTSTMRMIYGLSPVSAGTLTVLGHDVATESRALKRLIGVVPQEANLDMDMTALDNVVTFARFFDITGAPARSRAKELLASVQLEEKADARVATLSGGMKRRLLIARALVNDPALLVLDEPTTGLDPQSRALLWERIRDMRRAGKTVILTTHYMEEAERLSDELVLMDGGRIIERGTPRELVLRHIGREVLELELPRAEQERALKALADRARGSDRSRDFVLFHTDDAEALLREAESEGLEPASAVLRRASLEDVFLKLTGRTLLE